MNFFQITQTYLKAFQLRVQKSTAAGSKSLEMATRPEVDSYVKNLIAFCKSAETQLTVHHDIQYTVGSRPDWRVEDDATFGVFFFGDHKDTNFTNQFTLSAGEKVQIQRYLDFGRPVFVFDGLEFLIFKDSIETAERFELIKKPVLKDDDWAASIIDDGIVQKLKNLLNNPGFRQWSETELIEQLALRAKNVSSDISLLLSAPIGSGLDAEEELLIVSLHKLKKTIVEHHDPSLSNEKACSDFIAQVLTFGLFYAHTRNDFDSGKPDARLEKIKSFWKIESLDNYAKNLRPFFTIIKILSTSLLKNNVLSHFYNDIAGVLSHAEYMGTEKGPQDFHTLFEKFLEKFDKETKFDRGAFYTPPDLAKWMVRVSNEVAKISFGSGILDSAEKIIDPCCGTGSFLEALFTELKEDGKSFPSLVGFEILPAPYALSHYRLSEIIDEKLEQDISIILTDTLSDKLLDSVKIISNGFDDEAVEAINFSKPPLKFIFGNPPSAPIPKTTAPRTIIQKQIDDFRPPKKERVGRQNTQKALQNEAFLFLRWCCERLISSSGGLLSIVLPGAFIDSTSFLHARKWMLKHFDELYLLEIDHDLRVGQASHSLFNVQQGRLILIATLKEVAAKVENDIGAEVFHLDIRDLKYTEKLNFLNSPINLQKFAKIDILEPNYKYIPTGDFDGELWNKCTPLLTLKSENGIFKAKCSGIKLSPSSILFHTQRPILLRRSIEIGNKSTSVSEILPKWFSGQRKPPKSVKFSDDVRQEVASAATQTQLVKRYQFRPFLSGWFLDSDKIYAALKPLGGGTRDRPEVRGAIEAKAIGIAIAPAPKDVSKSLTRFACFVWNVPDNDLAARGNGMIYLNLFPQSKGEEPTCNIEQEVLNDFSFSENPSKSLLYYAYGILSSQTYLDFFDVALFTKSDAKNPPRVPFTTSLDIRKEVTRLGKGIADCENFEQAHETLHSITSCWPGNIQDFKLTKSSYDNENETLLLHGASDEEIKVHGVSPDVMDLHIMGHGVIEKWLRERTFAYLRRTFIPADLMSLQDTISRIQSQINLINELNPIVEKMLLSGTIKQFDQGERN